MKITKDENGITFDGEHNTIIFAKVGEREFKLEGFGVERINIMNFVTYVSDTDGQHQMEIVSEYLSKNKKKWYQFWK